MTPPAKGSFARAVAIRGDATQLGFAIGLSGLAVLGIAAGGGIAPSWAAVGAASLLPAFLLVRWGRHAYRALLAEVASEHAGHDPGPSPVPWMTDDLWHDRNRFDAVLDAPILLQREVEPGLVPFGEDASGAFTEPTVRPVTDDEREATPPGPVDADVVPPPMTPASAEQAILDTPGRFVLVGPRWPMCCGSLTTLWRIKAAERTMAEQWLPPAPVVEEDDAADARLPVDTSTAEVPPEGEGAQGYVCRRCGRRYTTDPTF